MSDKPPMPIVTSVKGSAYHPSRQSVAVAFETSKGEPLDIEFAIRTAPQVVAMMADGVEKYALATDDRSYQPLMVDGMKVITGSDGTTGVILKLKNGAELPFVMGLMDATELYRLLGEALLSRVEPA